MPKPEPEYIPLRMRWLAYTIQSSKGGGTFLELDQLAQWLHHNWAARDLIGHIQQASTQPHT